MLRDVITHLDFSVFAEIALAIFAVTFVLVTIATLRTDRRIHLKHASIALEDAPRSNDDA